MDKKLFDKSPAFQFYCKDWLSDLKVRSLSYEEKGVYIDLLATSWLEPIPTDTERLAKAMNITELLLCYILDMFFIKKDNFYYNLKLENYRKEKEKFIKSKSEAGKKGMNKRWSKQKQKDNTVKDLLLTKNNSSTSSSTSSNIISKDITDKSEVVEKKEKVKYGNEDINRMLDTIKELLFLEDFKETKKQQRISARNLVSLKEKLGKVEFATRFMKLAENEFHMKNMGSLEYIYKNIKGFVPLQKDNSIKDFT